LALKPALVSLTSPPRDMPRAVLGAPAQVPNAACITSATERLPLMFDPVCGFRFHVTGKAEKSHRSIAGEPPPAGVVNCGSQGKAGIASTHASTSRAATAMQMRFSFLV